MSPWMAILDPIYANVAITDSPLRESAHLNFQVIILQ